MDLVLGCVDNYEARMAVNQVRVRACVCVCVFPISLCGRVEIRPVIYRPRPGAFERVVSREVLGLRKRPPTGGGAKIPCIQVPKGHRAQGRGDRNTDAFMCLSFCVCGCVRRVFDCEACTLCEFALLSARASPQR